MSNVVSAPAGVYGPVMIGKYGGQREDKGRVFLIVTRPSPWDASKPYDERCEYSAFDPNTGQPTGVGEMLRNLNPGDPVAVQVDQRAQGMRDGRAFVINRAVAVYRLEVVSDNGTAGVPTLDSVPG